MQPVATGSLQPLKSPAVGTIRAVSLSAPELSPQPAKFSARRLTVFPPSLNIVKAEHCQEKLLTPDQLLTLGSLSSEDGISFLKSSLTQYLQPQLAILLYSVYHWTQINKFDSEKTIVLLTIYSKMFKFCLDSPWRSQSSMYSFFKESLLRNSIQHPPKSVRIFSPEESKDILLNFCHSFLTVLPLLRLNCLPNYRINVFWKMPPDEQVQDQK